MAHPEDISKMAAVQQKVCLVSRVPSRERATVRCNAWGMAQQIYQL